VYEVRADIRKLESYSGHGDYKEMIQFLECQDKSKLTKVFIVHGEYESQIGYQKHLEEAGFHSISIPAVGDEFGF
jgi:metallo-beta-lactamase family protein